MNATACLLGGAMSRLKVDVMMKTKINGLYSTFTSLCKKSFWKSMTTEWGTSISDMQLLLGALMIFTRDDASALFDNQKDVDERVMVGCVYRYMYCACMMGFCKSTQPDIDIEYDRMQIDHGKFGPKAFSFCYRPKTTCMRGQEDKCNSFVGREKWCLACRQCDRRVRPDLIIHKRNSDLGVGNGMIVEFKRNNVDDHDDNVKIAYATCEHGSLKYVIGAVVKLSDNTQVVGFYKDSVRRIAFTVYPDKVERCDSWHD